MNLHRAGRVPDWEKVPEGRRNRWQKLAAKTKGVITPGNAVFSAIAKARGVEIHSTRTGKDWTMACWMTIGSHAVESAAEDIGVEELAAVAGVSADLSYHGNTSAMGWKSTGQYLQAALTSPS
ncbi:MAG TPA: hypothetical protein VFX86_04770 [Candidatus Saccharimonadales bacterium]|nr:hypothetical protein [Candidatus Saccharimonadales bacterium]